MNQKVYHIVENLSLESGGLRTMINSLHEYLCNSHIPNEVITLKKESTDLYQDFKAPKNPWFYSRELKKNLNSYHPGGSIFHLHGVFFYPQYIANKTAKKRNIPDLVTAHGMLSNYLMEQKALKKTLYRWVILNKILKSANCLHAITTNEKDILFKMSGHKNIVEIPNLIHVGDDIPQSYKPKEEYLLYLGRYHNIKGIDKLIDAFERVSPKNLKLFLYGFKNEYSEYLQSTLKSKNLEGKVIFNGGVLGDEKTEVIQNAKALIYPSHNEVIGMVNLEAAALKTPVITTWGTGLKTEWSQKGGMLITPGVQEIADAIKAVDSWGTLERNDRGKQLFEFVKKEYSWESKGHLWNELYGSLSN